MSTVDKIVGFIVSHNEPIIEVTFALSIIVALYLAVKYFLSEDPGQSVSGAGADLSQIEETLKKILEQKPAGGLTGEQAAEYEALKKQVADMTADMTSRQEELEKLKQQAGSAGPGLSEEEKKNFLEKIRELESKLAEYEIISEDIADLSLYKDENQKLKVQLEDLKKSATEAPPAAPVTPAPEITPTPVAEVASSPPATIEPSSEYVDDEVMEEFAKAVEQQKAAGTETPAQAPAPKAVPPPAVNESNAPEAAVEPGLSAAQMDIDKMIAEAQAVENAATTETSSNALEETMNEDKLLNEATQFSEEVNEDASVMNQFNNFVKGDKQT